MRHIFHRILDRYLDGGQISFDASPREPDNNEPRRSPAGVQSDRIGSLTTSA